jgi:enoyl-CoA hydratase/carnithine racemase
MIDTTYEHLRVGVEHGGAVVTLAFDHGKANEIGGAQLAELDRLASSLSEDADARALITTSHRVTRSGTPIFVSGADVTERVGWSGDRVKAHVRHQREVLQRLRAAPVLHVVVVAGVAFGWGTEFLLTADYRIAAPGARFALPETGLGILPGAGGSSELHAAIGAAHALRLGLTGEVIDHLEAARIGLVQEVAADQAAGLQRARALGLLAATRSPTANAAFKATVLASEGLAAGTRGELEAQAYEHCVDSGEAAIGREHFAEIRDGLIPPWGERRLFRA